MTTGPGFSPDSAPADLGVRIALAQERLGSLGQRQVSIGALSTYRVGGAAALFVEVGSIDDLRSVSEAVRQAELPTLIVGKGSNLLVADDGFPGVAIMLSGFTSIAFAATAAGPGDLSAVAPSGSFAGAGPLAPLTVRAEGLAALPVVARKSVAQSLTGFEWAVGVPGSIGGAVRMNAGGHGSDMAACLTRIRRWRLGTGEDEVVPASDLELSYRSSNTATDDVVLWAELELAAGDREASEAELSEIVRWRRANQPGGSNAGSVFTNPPGDSAGRLIDAAGCKGLRLGTAVVSEKHANFIQADAGGSADDVLALMHEVGSRVASTFGIELHAETRVVGRFSVPPRTVAAP